MRKTRTLPPSDQPWTAYCRFPATMVSGNRVSLLLDGAQAYPVMLEAIAGARRTILMESYIFNDDTAGRRFSDALTERARAGVRVFLNRDGVGTVHVPDAFFDEMEKSGVHVLEYRPVAPWRRGFGLLRRNHRKLLVVDGKVGFAGGLNVGDEWLPEAEGGQNWHDVHVRIEGPAVREMSRLAMATWKRYANVDLDPRIFLPVVEPVGTERVSVIGSRERKNRKAIRESYLYAIRRAERYIYIANAYFLPDRGFRRALSNACSRGVDVRVMVPSESDHWFVQLASQSLFSRLLRAGVRLFLWQDAMLHAKTAVIDDEWATVGSFNIDHQSWLMNLEVNVNVLGPGFAGSLKNVFLADQNRCRELTAQEWARRPIIQRVLERFFHLFRKWM